LKTGGLQSIESPPFGVKSARGPEMPRVPAGISRLFINFVAVVLFGLRLPADEFSQVVILELGILDVIGRAEVEKHNKSERRNQKQRNPE
jgi:hypothetical protein